MVSYHLKQVVAINSINILHRTIFGRAGPILAAKFGTPDQILATKMVRPDRAKFFLGRLELEIFHAFYNQALRKVFIRYVKIHSHAYGFRNDITIYMR